MSINRAIYKEDVVYIHWNIIQSLKRMSSQDGRVKGCVLISCNYSKITPHCWTTIKGECWIPPKKDIPHPRAKEKPQQDSRRGKITFRIKPHTRQRCSEGSNKTLCTPGSRDPTETEADLCWVSCGGTGQQWPAAGAGALGAATWVTQPVAQALLEEVAVNPTIEPLSRWPQTADQLYQRN